MGLNREIKFITKLFILLGIFLFSSIDAYAQVAAPNPDPKVNEKAEEITAPAVNANGFEEVIEDPNKVLKILDAEPNKKRVRRHLSLIQGVKIFIFDLIKHSRFLHFINFIKSLKNSFEWI